MAQLSSVDFLNAVQCFHIYRKVNNCADKLASVGLVLDVILGEMISLLLLRRTYFVRSLSTVLSLS